MNNRECLTSIVGNEPCPKRTCCSSGVLCAIPY